MYGYATPEMLRLAGNPVKRLALRRAPEAPSAMMPDWLFQALRQAKLAAQVLPQAMEAGLERLVHAGGSLYFQGRNHVD
jgi:hypothetical protein